MVWADRSVPLGKYWRSAHLAALIPGEGAFEFGGQGGHGGGECVTDGLGVAIAGQVDEQDVAGGAFDQGADLGSLVFADDEVAFPVAGYGPVGGFGGAFADHHHGGGETGLALVGAAVWDAAGAAGPQRPG